MNDYHRWRWQQCPRTYHHISLDDKLPLAIRRDISSKPIFMGSDRSKFLELSQRYSCCCLLKHEEITENMKVIRKVPLYCRNLSENASAEEDSIDLQFDFSHLEALALGW